MDSLNLEEEFMDYIIIPKAFKTLFNNENSDKKRADLFMPENIEDHCNFLYPKFNKDKLKLNLDTNEIDLLKIHDSIISFTNKKQKTITTDNIIRIIENENYHKHNRNQSKRRKNINLDDLIIILQNSLYSIYLLKRKNVVRFYLNKRLEESTIKELKFDKNVHNYHLNYYDLCKNIFYLLFDNLIIRYDLELLIPKIIHSNDKNKLLFEGNQYLTSTDYLIVYNTNSGDLCVLKWLIKFDYSYKVHKISCGLYLSLFDNNKLLIFDKSSELLNIINLDTIDHGIYHGDEHTIYISSTNEIISNYSNEKYQLNFSCDKIIYFKKYNDKLFIVVNEFLIIYDLSYDDTGLTNSNTQKRIIKFENKILLFKIYFNVIFILEEESLKLNICNINGVIYKNQQLNCKKDLLKKSMYYIKINRDKLITMYDNIIIIGITDKLFKINITK